MEDLTFDVESLVIKLYTNIPDKNNTIVEFTRSMLHIPPDENKPETDNAGEDLTLENYPLFVADVEYPKYILNKMDYNERVKFFFNKKEFIRILKTNYKPPVTDTVVDEVASEALIKMNIMTMIEVLFPTKFPVINDIHSSHTFLSDKQSNRPFWFNPFETHYFSYLKINNQIYTTKRAIWLNDILNHPVYHNLLVEYRKLKKWVNSSPNNSQYLTNTLTDTMNAPPIEFRKFKTVMTEHVQMRTTSNVMLQTLFNGLISAPDATDDSENSATKYYDFMEALMNKFINTKPSGDNTEFDNLLDYANVGITGINRGETTSPTREVYIMIDLVEGEMNDNNIRDIYCSFVGDHLGNQLKHLINEYKTKITNNKWSVDENREMFSLKKIQSSAANNSSTLELTKKALPNSGNPLLSKNAGESAQNIEKLKSNFTTYILDSTEPGNPVKLHKYIDDALKSNTVFGIDTDFTDSTKMFEFLKNNKTNEFASNLYKILVAWNTDITYKNMAVEKDLLGLSYAILAKNDYIKNTYLKSDEIKYARTEAPKNAANHELLINDILKHTLAIVLAHEKSKVEKSKGGTRKRRSRQQKQKTRRVQ